jgi:hypothetical protein
MALAWIIPKSYSGGYRGQSEAFWLEDSEALETHNGGSRSAGDTTGSLLDPVDAVPNWRIQRHWRHNGGSRSAGDTTGSLDPVVAVPGWRIQRLS